MSTIDRWGSIDVDLSVKLRICHCVSSSRCVTFEAGPMNGRQSLSNKDTTKTLTSTSSG